MKQIKKELLDIKKEYAIDRKTEIKDEITEIKIDQEALIVKEDVIVVVTKEGYVKRTPKRSYNSSNDEDITLKDNDYIIGLYEMNTIDTLLLFTNQGNYLYVPVYELPDMKWKEMGKHISNIITIKDDEKIVYSMPVYDFNQKEVVTIFSKNGMVKRCNLLDFKVQRYNKPITCMKLKYDDEIVSVTNSPYTEVFISPNKYMSLNNSGNVHILGRLDTKKLLAYLVVLEIISNLSMFDASIPEGAINSFSVFSLNISYCSSSSSAIILLVLSNSLF